MYISLITVLVSTFLPHHVYCI